MVVGLPSSAQMSLSPSAHSSFFSQSPPASPNFSGEGQRRLRSLSKSIVSVAWVVQPTDLPCCGWGRRREMSMTLVQPVGQKRLTNVAVVRLQKRGVRFEISCYKNKVLSWRSGVEKDLDEVLQSQTVYSNVSKGILAKSKDLQKAFDSEDQLKICLEILEKGELQVAGKERESQFNSQFRDVATIVMEKTINPDTQRPYTISMIERLMHEIHFAVDPNKSSKKQALEIIRELQKHFPINRAPMRIRLTIPDKQLPSLMEKIVGWNATVVTKDQSGNQISMICEMEPGVFRDCDAIIRNLLGKLEILAVSAHVEGESQVVDQYEDQEKLPIIAKESNGVVELDETMQQLTVSKGDEGDQQVKQTKCSTCNAVVGDLKEYREHFKSEWHKHNLKRKTRQLPPLSAEECLNDLDIDNVSSDLKEYSF